MAYKKYIEGVEITTEHAHALIKTVTKLGIQCIVAPYEADAQLAYLYKAGIADFVITEDSDLLAFGAMRTFLKMDKDGRGTEIDLSMLKKCRDLNFEGFDHDLFLTTCIMGGCDYLESVKGIGFKKAYKYVSGATGDLNMIMKRLKVDGFNVPDDYLKRFDEAFLTFNFQVVYCPIKKEL